MPFIYEQRKRPREHRDEVPANTGEPGPGFSALMTGAARPSAAQKGRPIDLDGAIRAKMEHAFGDLSAVKLYESQAVGQAGAEAIAQGSEIAFAPGMADFSSRSGQERLGHELSHVMSQRSGAVRGGGFLASASLEARADREGAMAAAGEQVYTGPVTSALSSASPSPAAAGPMQAKRYGETAWREESEAKLQGVKDTVELPDDDPDAFQMRPWQISEHQLEKNHFNPTNRKDLAMAQAQIDAADSPRNAYSTFAAFAGSGNSRLTDKQGLPWDPTEVDPKRFKAKLKNMLRMVYDYPELRGKIGHLQKTTDLFTTMSARSTYGGKKKSQLEYNTVLDRGGLRGAGMRFIKKILDKFGHSAAPGEYTGTHELGHVLNSLLLDPENEDAAKRDWSNGITSDDMLKRVLSDKKVLSPEERETLTLHNRTDDDKGFEEGQIDLKKSKLYDKGITSRYGQTNSNEFFAEAFADVYAHGNKARPASIALVKEYERRRKVPKKK